MTTATVSEIGKRLPELLALVRAGETVEITDDGKPVAQLVPAPFVPPPPRYLTPEEEKARLDRLEKAGVIRRGTGQMPNIPLPEGAPRSSGVLDALLEERRTGR